LEGHYEAFKTLVELGAVVDAQVLPFTEIHDDIAAYVKVLGSKPQQTDEAAADVPQNGFKGC
jgi:hypothetical protein